MSDLLDPETEPVSESEAARLREALWERIESIPVVRDILVRPEVGTPVDPLVKEDLDDRQADRALRKSYANRWFKVLVVQLVVMNVVFIAVGLGRLQFTEWAINVYVTGTLAQVFLVVRDIVKYLFRMPK